MSFWSSPAPPAAPHLFGICDNRAKMCFKKIYQMHISFSAVSSNRQFCCLSKKSQRDTYARGDRATSDLCPPPPSGGRLLPLFILMAAFLQYRPFSYARSEQNYSTAWGMSHGGRVWRDTRVNFLPVHTTVQICKLYTWLIYDYS